MITSSFSFFATAEAISAVGATPVFVDVEAGSYLIDPERIEAAITPATRALLPVHLFGRPVDMERIRAIALRRSTQPSRWGSFTESTAACRASRRLL
ncbi:MAG: DegT/DnrJ/EryC1/StrS family aminotransferase [Cyanobium sp.]